MVQALTANEDRTFVWAEVCFFAQWWDDVGESERAAAKRLIQNKQLEILTGGWVSNAGRSHPLYCPGTALVPP